jgi:hypothetical protein
MKLVKIQNRFLWFSLEYNFALGLTKSLFVHHCSIENSYKSNLGVFNCKNP